jgi:hypothetical protein
VVGNCSVKNNHAGMHNRMGRIYKFIKAYELDALKQEMKIPVKLLKEKELQNELATIKHITKDNFLYSNHIEKIFTPRQRRKKFANSIKKGYIKN